MKKRIRSFGVLQTGIVVGALYAVLGLVFLIFFVPIGILGIVFSGETDEGVLPFIAFLVMGLFMPIMYGVMGFIMGMIACLIYNGVARFTGGIEIELVDLPSTAALPGSTPAMPTAPPPTR